MHMHGFLFRAFGRNKAEIALCSLLGWNQWYPLLPCSPSRLQWPPFSQRLKGKSLPYVPAEMAMVPFADLFNHKAAVVQLGGGYFVEDVCFEDQDSSSEEEEDEEDVEAEDEVEDEEEEDEEVEDEEDQNRRSQVSGLCKSLSNLAKLHDAHEARRSRREMLSSKGWYGIQANNETCDQKQRLLLCTWHNVGMQCSP